MLTSSYKLLLVISRVVRLSLQEQLQEQRQAFEDRFRLMLVLVGVIAGPCWFRSSGDP